jgi:hypothetical protein
MVGKSMETLSKVEESPQFYPPESMSFKMMASHTPRMESTLKEDKAYLQADLGRYYLPITNANPTVDLFQELSTHEVSVGRRRKYSISTVLSCSYFKQGGEATSSPITGISHEDGLWALHGPDRELLAAVAHKAEERLKEHLDDNSIFVGNIHKVKEDNEGGITPCALDKAFGKVDMDCTNPSNL